MWKLGSCGGPHVVSILMIDTTCFLVVAGYPGESRVTIVGVCCCCCFVVVVVVWFVLFVLVFVFDSSECC